MITESTSLVLRQRLNLHPVFAAFGLTHRQHLTIKIHVFHTQAQALHQAHARVIQQFGQQSHFAIGKDLGRQAVEANLRFKSVLIDFAAAH